MTDPSYFDDLYRDDPDPWLLATADYERVKRALTIASLPRDRYATAFEPGCGPGHLTRMLAPQCDRVIATDLAQHAVDEVRALDLPNVDARIGAIPLDWPDEPLDLVVLVEVLYFLTPDDRAEVARRTREALEPGGHVVAVHWKHDFDAAASRPAESHADLHAIGLAGLVRIDEPDFVLEVFHDA